MSETALDQLNETSRDNVEELSRSIYDTTVVLDGGEYKAFLSLFYNHMALVAMRSSQDDRIRRYTWRYNVIREVKSDGFNHLSLLYDIMGKDAGNTIQQLDLQFPLTEERDSFAFRIKTLSNLYRIDGKKSQGSEVKAKSSRFLRRNNSESSFTDSETSTNTERPKCSETKDKSSPHTANNNGDNAKSKPTIIQFDDMFSAENLAKIANSKLSSLGSPGYGTNNDTESSSDVNITLPMELDIGIPNFSLKAEAVIRLQLKLDLPAICGSLKIADRETRLYKIRQSIEFNFTDCKLIFV